jgi:hypothetical protein
MEHGWQPGQAPLQQEGIKWLAHAHVDKYDPDTVAELTEYLGHEPTSYDYERFSIKPDDQAEAKGNALTNAGLTRITTLIIGGGGLAYTNTTGRIGTGDSNTAFDATHTDLQAASGSTHRYFMTLDATYPQVSVGVITSRATFGTADGNYAWQEWCWDVTAATVAAGTTVGTTMLNRKVASLGTKASGASWVFTATITLS